MDVPVNKQGPRDKPRELRRMRLYRTFPVTYCRIGVASLLDPAYLNSVRSMLKEPAFKKQFLEVVLPLRSRTLR